MDKKRQDRTGGSPPRKEDRGNREGRERRENAGNREHRDFREGRERRDHQEDREYRESAGNREHRDFRENRKRRSLQEDRERRDFQDYREQEEADGVIEGRNAVIEALRAGVRLDKVYIQKGETDRALGHIASTARETGAVVVDADRRKLDAMSRTHAHQGVIALASVREYVPVEDLLAQAEQRGEPPLLVVCDGITDPGNLGAILRTAECAGAHGVILPKRRSAGLTAVVAKTSAGAVAHMLVSRVSNLPSLLKDLKKQGVWVYGAAAEGDAPLYRTDFKGPAAIVIGSEGEGLSRLVRETCDALVSIPLRGQVGSLNAAAAAAVLLYEAVRQRGETA